MFKKLRPWKISGHLNPSAQGVKHHAMKVYVEVEAKLHTSLNSVLDGDE
jgi:hypothetical protein